MLRNPFLTPNPSASVLNGTRVTASGFTDSEFSRNDEEVLRKYSKSVLDIPEPGYKHPIIKLNGPVPDGFEVGLHSWYDADNCIYTKEVLIKENPSVIGPNSYDNQMNKNNGRFSFTPGDDLNKTVKNFVTEKGQKKRETRFRRKDSFLEDSGLGTETEVQTIKPNDSVSQVRPLNYIRKEKDYNNNGEVAVGLNQRFEQSVAISNAGSCFYNDVIGGYGQSADEKLDELDAISRIQKVTGLPQIFVNSRLNFLIHIHKPLEEIMSKGSEYPSEDSLWKLSEFIRKYKTSRRDPHKDLLFQVITTTIKNDKIRANPFCLPLLEVGMYLNDKLIYISFSQLYQEYQIEWFKSMKDIEPPRFHAAYKSFSSTKGERNHSHPESRRRKKSGSVISSLGF